MFQDGRDAASAFVAAHAVSVHDSKAERSWPRRHTLADKPNYQVVSDYPLPMDRALSLSWHLLRQEPFGDPRGPAGAIPVTGGRRALLIDLSAEACDNPTNVITNELSKRLTKGEKVADAIIKPSWVLDENGKVRYGTAVVHTIGASVHTGWLFFGSVAR
ncbi:hypothetical protein [Labedaea rhizosphaerae]|uniref:hypothetical protein n=1 Tax=Labedaea rhizosphaerae TaxID=598644 RepID=UPI0014150A66|nr:hypothetical protein [Labedaea rhizosphaerae]